MMTYCLSLSGGVETINETFALVERIQKLQLSQLETAVLVPFLVMRPGTWTTFRLIVMSVLKWGTA